MAQKKKNQTSAPEKGKTPPNKPKNLPRQGFFRRNSFSIILFLASFVVFGNGIFNEYALDDEFYTNGSNKLTQKGIKGIPEIFKSRTFFNNDGSGYSYRPVVLSVFAIEIQFFGEQPHVSHFFNVLLYALTMVLLFRLLRRWFKAQGDWFTFFVCLIFLVHPIHTEVVDNIKCRDEQLAFFFSVLAMLFMWKHYETGKKRYLILYPLSFFLAILSKHTAIPFLVLTPLASWFFMDTSWKKRILYVIPLIVMALLTVLMQKLMLPPQSRTYLAFENPLPESHFGNVTATAFYVLGRYLWLMFIPYPLVYYYGYRYIPMADWSNIISIASLVIHIALGLLALRELRRRTILGFGLTFYLINLAAYSNLLQPAPGLMAERFVYAASLGFCVVLVWLVFRLLKLDPAGFRWKLDTYKTAQYLFTGLALVFTVQCWSRNEDWEDKMTLYSHDIRYTGESAKANMLLGSLLSMKAMQRRLAARNYRQQGNQYARDTAYANAKKLFEEARGYYAKAGEIAPYYHTAWSNLGTTYFFLESETDTTHEMTRQALFYFKRSIKEKPNYSEGLFNTAMAYDRLGESDSAVYYFGLSIASDSTYMSSYEQMSRVLFQQQNKPEEALDLLRKGARKNPESEVPWNNIASIYLQMKDTVSGAAAMEMAAQINPGNVQRLSNLAEYFRRKGDATKYSYYVSLARQQQELQQQNGEQQQQQRRRIR